jgi:uncharacterized small protein (DUF1192 family)
MDESIYALNAECSAMHDEIARLNAECSAMHDEIALLESENARLRSCLSDNADNAREIMVENAKLREYARKLLTGYACGRGELCEVCSWNGWDGDCNARMKARELGVEVPK